jgi:hypothetical protein
MLSEYEAILYMKWKTAGDNEKEWERRCGERLAASVLDDRVRQYRNCPNSAVLIYEVGSVRLIEYSLSRESNPLDKNTVFLSLYQYCQLFNGPMIYLMFILMTEI